MKIKVLVKPKSRQNKIEIDDDVFKVNITEITEKGKANKALIKLLAEYFRVSKSNIHIVSGKTSHIKIIEVEDV